LAFKIATKFQLASRLELCSFFSHSSNIVLVIVSIAIKLAFRNNHVLGQLYFFRSLPLSSVEIILNVTSMRLKRIFTKLNFALWNEFLSWSTDILFVKLVSICRLTWEFIFWHNEVLLNHFVFALRLVIIVFGVILIVRAMELTVFGGLRAFMLAYISRDLPQLHASHIHFPCALWICSVFCLSWRG